MSIEQKIKQLSTSSDIHFVEDIVKQAVAIEYAADRTISETKMATIVSGARAANEAWRADVADIQKNTRLVFTGVDNLPFRISENNFVSPTIKLSRQPSANVTITPSCPGDSDIAFSPASMTFSTSNWNTAQTLNIVSQTDTDNIETASIVYLTIAGGGFDILEPIEIPIVAVE